MTVSRKWWRVPGVILFGLTIALLLNLPRAPEPTPTLPVVDASGIRINPEVVARAAEIEARELELDRTLWATEILAQDCGRTFESLWNSLNRSSSKLTVAASFAVPEIVLPALQQPERLPHDIQLFKSSGPGLTLDQGGWRKLLTESESAGWRLSQIEFRHRRFETNGMAEPWRSEFEVNAHLTNAIEEARAVVEGNLIVEWAATRSADGLHEVKRIDATRLAMKRREGAPGFLPILEEHVIPFRNSRSIDPLIVYDLDGDGLSEIILAANNVVYRRRGTDHYEAAPLCRYAPGPIYSAILGDFDGDGHVDFLCLKYEGLFLFKGSARGTFDEPGHLVWGPDRDMKHPMAMTCGDVDGDGDLDLFIAQYRMPFEAGAMPAPYYDANDGYPSFLLLNDGRGSFSDATSSSGLDGKRLRRAYCASLPDLDGDGHLDLAVASDFAGLDLYRNNGRGHFSDVTRQWVAEPHGFGMALAFTDFNADGRLDLFMTGMTSATADRLEHLNLWRSDVNDDRRMRKEMTFGNRLLLGRSQGGFEQTSLGESVARSGWSWGCAAADFDNDGFPDVYIANGMETRESVEDYEGEFWLHDAFVANATNGPAADLYLKGKLARLRGHGQSYGGNDRNRFFLNQRGESFVEIGHLTGLALEEDSRNVVADDLDRDGGMDLVVTSFEDWPGPRQILRVYKNVLADCGNWIGFRLREQGAGKSPVGAQVKIRVGSRNLVRQTVAGESYRSQGSSTVHFGLGEANRVDTAEIRWTNGQAIVLHDLDVNRYYTINSTNATDLR